MADITANQHTGVSNVQHWDSVHVRSCLACHCQSMLLPVTVSSLQMAVANAELQWELSGKAVHEGGMYFIR